MMILRIKMSRLRYLVIIQIAILVMGITMVSIPESNAKPVTGEPYMDPWKVDISGMPDLSSIPPYKEGPINWTPVRLPSECKSADGSENIIMVSRGSSDNLLIYMEGGGASWNYQMVRGKIPVFPLNWLTGKRSIMMHPWYGELKFFYRMGIFDRLNPENPFKDWNIVFIPYVNEDVMAGNREAVYTDPATGRTETVYHLGHANTTVAIRWAAEEFKDPDHILLCGSSAGGYGCWANWLDAKEAFGQDKPVDMFSDCGPGLICPPGYEENDLQRSNWGYTDIIPNEAMSYLKDDGQIIWLAEWIHDAYPIEDHEDKFIIFDYENDIILGPMFLKWTPKQWENYLNTALDEIMDYTNNDPRMVGLLGSGCMHTILMLPTFYTQQVSGTVGGQEYHDVRVVDWANWLVYDTPLPSK